MYRAAFVSRYPAVCINPMSIDDYDELDAHQIVVRSFKTGKIQKVSRSARLMKNNVPGKVEPVWKGDINT